MLTVWREPDYYNEENPRQVYNLSPAGVCYPGKKKFQKIAKKCLTNDCPGGIISRLRDEGNALEHSKQHKKLFENL